jgi:uncharacterized protein (TIGR03435 family)
MIRILLVLVSVQAFAQSEFEVADVHASPRGAFPHMSGGMMHGDRYELHSATMVDLIRVAWGVDADKVSGGPSWLETDRFEVIAQAAPATPPDALPQILQRLLADRFGLVVHPDKRPLPAFVLAADKNPRLKAADGRGDSGCEPKQNTQTPNVMIACHNITMADFAVRIGGMAGGEITHPVIDVTELKGTWDFNLTWTPRKFVDAVNKQLGLRLEQRNVLASVIVVDRVNETPTPNAPGVTQSLPAAPAQFEVANVMLSAPDEVSGGGFLPGGRVDLRAIPLRQLIMMAWTVSDDMIVDAPKWMKSARIDIIAKTPASPQTASAVGLPVDMDAMRVMLRALLVDRFKLAVHNEARPTPAYALVVTKSRLKQPDPSNRSGCTQSGGSPDANTLPVFTYTCRGTTMAQLAVKLRQMIGSEEINHPVVDATGLEGTWDFDFTWSPPSVGRTSGGPASADGVAAASDPAGAPSLMEALDKQLGLKLELQKRSMSVLVVDHVDEKPADN